MRGWFNANNSIFVDFDTDIIIRLGAKNEFVFISVNVFFKFMSEEGKIFLIYFINVIKNNDTLSILDYFFIINVVFIVVVHFLETVF